MSFLITSVLNCASDRLAISSLLSCIFFWSFDLFFPLGHFFFLFFFFWSWHACYIKGRSPRCSLGWGKAGRCALTLHVGEGPRGSNGTRSTLCRISVTPSATHNQTGPLGCWFPSGWACAHSRPLWVSPTTSPVRLGVSSAAVSTPTGVFNHRFEALFPCAGALGYGSALLPTVRPGLSMRECGASGCYPQLCLPCSPPL